MTVSPQLTTENIAWRPKALLLFHLLGAFLFVSLFWPLTKEFWESIDVAVFKWLNTSLKDRPLWQLFWACANHKWADWVEDICILGFFVAYVRSAAKSLKMRKISELVFCVLWIAAILYFVNRLLFRENLDIPRLSPTLVIDDSVRLSQEIPWMSIKDDSSKSFPGDHATTAILFAATFTYLAGWRLGLLACFYAAFLCILS